MALKKSFITTDSFEESDRHAKTQVMAELSPRNSGDQRRSVHPCGKARVRRVVVEEVVAERKAVHQDADEYGGVYI